ncbi:MAG: hypothetical protein HKN72_11755 [Gemmatimonadetes bacterium]|nr:hypothetical protein [Gemmatimonadota bacterium]
MYIRTMSQNGRMTEPPATTASLRGGAWLPLSLLLLVALGVHLWLLGARWVNPDEGAHLMDGVLLLDGLFPGIDYGARQPFYVLATAAVLEVFGVGFGSGRMLALICTLGTAAFLYFIARDLFDAKVALLSAGLFLFLPFPLILSVNAKTEPLAILLAASAIWLGLKGMRGRGGTALYFVGAGAVCALGFYVRESSLAILAALVVILVWRLRRAPGRAVGGMASITAGFVGVCLLWGALHAANSSVEDAWTSGNNPIVFVSQNIRQAIGGGRGDAVGAPDRGATQPGPSDGVEENAAEAQGAPPDQAFAVTLRFIRESVWLNIVLIVGLVLYPVVLVTGRGRQDPGEGPEPSISALLPLAWAGSMAAAYLFWALQRGFFRAYFMEISAPLTILAAATLVYSAREFVESTSRRRMGLGLALLVLALLAIPALFGSPVLSRPLYFLVPVAALALVHFFDTNDARRWLPALLGVVGLSVVGFQFQPRLPGVMLPGLYLLWITGVLVLVLWAARISWVHSLGKGVSFGIYGLIVSALFLSVAESLSRVNLRYDAVWSPQTVRTVGQEVRSITGPGDDVLSGAVIWELQAERRPYMNISHPLSFRLNLDDEEAASMQRALAEDLPSVVVLDGYTEQTWFRAVPELPAILEARYERTLAVEADTRYPVEVYRLKE